MSAAPSSESTSLPRRQLTLFDTTSIIVGIIIGSGIYKTSPLIAQSVPSAAWFLGVWVIGGAFALIGSLCYAELAAAFPLAGGDYVFLTRAFGRPAGFLFAWAGLWVVRPGSVGAMAFVFADYANRVLPLGPNALVPYALASVAVLSVVNVFGVVPGKWTQNVLTSAKVLGLLAVVVIGFTAGGGAVQGDDAVRPARPEAWGLAMILIMYAYGGWNDLAFVSAEVRDPDRNLKKALVLGTLAVTLIYLLVNAAFVRALGFEGTRAAQAVAADVVQLRLGNWGAGAVSLLVCISALSAINGMVLTGARVYYALGREHSLFAPLGHWSARFGAPVRSLLVQGLITLAVVGGFGGLTADQGSAGDGFTRMVNFALPIFWFFLLLVGCSLFVLRWREPDVRRPFRVPLYPLTPLVFCSGTLFMLYSSADYAWKNRSVEALWAAGIMVAGIALCFFDRPRTDRISGMRP